jgi:hypothetical protein
MAPDIYFLAKVRTKVDGSLKKCLTITLQLPYSADGQ